MNLPINNLTGQAITEYDLEHLINAGDNSQYEGNYQEATSNYLQAFEILYQITINNTQGTRDTESLTSQRSKILEKLGDNLIHVGQYNIAIEFYNQKLRIETSNKNSLARAFAYHKLGFCYYFMELYKSSLDFQKQSLDILPSSSEEEELEFKSLRCKIHLCIGLNQYKLCNYDDAVNSYEKALDIARQYGLQNEEAEIIANLSHSVREKLSREYGRVNMKLLETVMGDLYYVIRIAKKNPYLKSLALKELAKIHENTDVDIAQKYVEESLNISKIYGLPFSQELQYELDKILQSKQEQLEQKYILEEQPWYCSRFPETEEIDKETLELAEFKADFVIITATPTELQAVVHLLEECISERHLPCRQLTPWGTYYLGKFGHYKTVVTQCRMGTRDERGAGFVTQKALEIWKPKAVIMVGIAFGKSSTEQKIGDVLVATEIIDYDVNRIGRDGIVDRGSRPPSNRNLLGLFEQAYEWKFCRPDNSYCKLIPGPILSGDKLVDNPEFKADLFKRFPHAKGGEMEGIGFCSAANSLNKPWILIKAICDWADGKKKDNHQPLAAAAAVNLVKYVLSQKTILECFE